MKLSLLVASLVLSLSSVASAKPKHPKPVTCVSFSEQSMVIEGENQKVAICTDRAKPVILTTYQVVTFKSDDGETVKGVIGYR